MGSYRSRSLRELTFFYRYWILCLGCLESPEAREAFRDAINIGKATGNLMYVDDSEKLLKEISKKQKEKKFKIILPVGLEKRIPISLEKARKGALKTQKAQGIPCGMWRIRGKVVTEIDAFRQLFDVEAIPISAGGVCGAEGAIVGKALYTGDINLKRALAAVSEM